MVQKRRFHPFATAGLLCFGLTWLAPVSYGGTLVFDNFTGRTYNATSSTPNTFMGDGYVVAPGTTNISEIGYFPVNLSGTTYTGLQTTFYFWGTLNTSGTVNAGSPAFSNLLATYTDTQIGTFASGFYFPLDYVLPAPLAISDTTIGLTMNVQGTTDGITYNSVNSLTGLIGSGAVPVTGSNVFNGYYRNANSETNGNFTSSLRSLGLTNQSVAYLLYTDPVPEPGTVLLICGGVSILGLLRRRQSCRANR